MVADRTDDWEVGDDLDLYDEMTAITVRVIAQTPFSTELDPEETTRFAAANATIGQEFELSPLTIVRQFVPTPPSSEYRAAVSDLHEWAEGLIADRRAMDDRPEDLVTTMLRAEADPDVDLPPNQVRDEVLTFLFAGHETRALTLAYALWFTAATDGVADRVRSEARAVLDGRSVPDWDDLSELEYTEQVVREAIRLRPPSWSIFRQGKLDSRPGDARIEGDDYLLLPQWTLHRDARFFDQPERFDPARWDDRDPSTTPAYFPFGAGPHACIGRQLALTEAQLLLATLLARFDFDVEPGAIDELRPAGVLQPRGGIPATVRSPE